VKQRVLFDSGVLVAAAILPQSKAARWIDKGISYYHAEFEVYISAATIDRAKAVSKAMPYVDNDLVDEFFNVLPSRINVVPGSTRSNAEETLSAADICNPHLIIAGDEELVKLGKYNGIGIYHPKDFQEFLSGSNSS
jgi:predicted nucleic acid-binding protein